MLHQEVTFNLLQRVQYNTHQDEEGGSTEELGKLLLHTEYAGKSWHDGDEGYEE